VQERELLELAAKAHGRITFDKTGLADVFLDQDRNLSSWDPLTDDGDALRLAVKLDISVDIDRVDAVTYVNFGYFAERNLDEPHGNDPYAATRRAIVRAAAEIGRAR